MNTRSKTFIRRRGVQLIKEPIDEEGTSASLRACTVPNNNLQAESLPVPTMIDTDDDDVIELSASDFAKATRKSKRARCSDRDQDGTTRLSVNIISKRRWLPSLEPRIERKQAKCKKTVNVDEVKKRRRVFRSNVPARPVQEELQFMCPICIGPFTDEMATRCGHIFCMGCIKKAIFHNGKCPTCREKVTPKELRRVFLPAIRPM